MALPTYIGKTSGVGESGGASISHQVVAGTTLLLVYVGTEAPNRTITLEKFDGNNLTTIYETASGSYLTEGWYYLANPDIKTANITATIGPASNWCVCGINLKDVDLDDIVGNQNESKSASASSRTTNVTEAAGADAMHFHGVALGAVTTGGLRTISWGGGQDEIFQAQRDAFGNVTWGASRKDGEGDGTTTMTSSWGANENCTAAQVEIKGITTAFVAGRDGSGTFFSTAGLWDKLNGILQPKNKGILVPDGVAI